MYAYIHITYTSTCVLLCCVARFVDVRQQRLVAGDDWKRDGNSVIVVCLSMFSYTYIRSITTFN